MFAWVGALLLACGEEKEPFDSASDPEDGSCFSHPPRIEVGQGEQEFQSFADPAEAIMIHGPQGGWHILASMRISGMMDVVEVYYSIEHLASGVLVSDNTYRLAVVSDGNCSGVYPGMYGYLSVVELYDGELDTPPELLGGESLRIRMRVNDCTEWMQSEAQCIREDRWAEAEVDVTATLDPIDQNGN